MDRNAEAWTIMSIVYRDIVSRDNSVPILERLEASGLCEREGESFDNWEWCRVTGKIELIPRRLPTWECFLTDSTSYRPNRVIARRYGIANERRVLFARFNFRFRLIVSIVCTIERVEEVTPPLYLECEKINSICIPLFAFS